MRIFQRWHGIPLRRTFLTCLRDRTRVPPEKLITEHSPGNGLWPPGDHVVRSCSMWRMTRARRQAADAQGWRLTLLGALKVILTAVSIRAARVGRAGRRCVRRGNSRAVALRLLRRRLSASLVAFERLGEITGTASERQLDPALLEPGSSPLAGTGPRAPAHARSALPGIWANTFRTHIDGALTGGASPDDVRAVLGSTPSSAPLGRGRPNLPASQIPPATAPRPDRPQPERPRRAHGRFG